jgi:RHS repeat-associated protein
VSGSVNWTYDANYRKTSQSVNGGQTINFSYDNDDLLTGAGAMTLTRDATNGLLSGTTLGTTTEAMTYNSLGEVATATSSVSGSPILSETYTRDSLGRISTKTETIQGVTTTFGYTYDVAGRLTEVTHNGAVVSAYSYDSNGNRVSKTAPGGTVTGTYDDQDRLLAYNGNTYTYTANGELASKSSTQHPAPSTYSYDALGNLRSATLSDGTTIGYIIDGENRRIGKTVDGALVQGFLYENQLEPVAELDGGGNLISRFVYCGCGAGNIPQYMLKGGVTYRIVSDHLGSPRLVVDSATGVVAQRMDYDEFGNVTLDTNPGFQPFGFAGGIYDRDTGLVRHGARDYDPETGRWTAKDPIKFRGKNPFGCLNGDTNLYSYALNDAINYLDIDGRLSFAQVAVGVGIYSILTTIGTAIYSTLQAFGSHRKTHCFASCLATRANLLIPLGPMITLTAIEIFQATNRHQPWESVAVATEYNWEGAQKAWDVSRTCRELCTGAQ